MIRFTALFIIILTVFPQVYADTVTLNNGDEIYGTIKEISKDSVVILNDKGEDRKLSKKDILKVSWQNFIKIAGEVKTSDIKDQELLTLLKSDISEKSYPDAGHVTLIDEMIIKVEENGRMTEKVHLAYKILKERSRDLANVSFYYKKGDQTGEIEFARTIHGDSIYYLNDESVEDESVEYLLKEYEKTHKKKFAIPKASVDSVIEYSYKINTEKMDIFDPFYGEFYFCESDPKKICRLVVEIPKSMKFFYEIRNNDGGLVKLDKEEKDGLILYKFYANDIPGYVSEVQMPPQTLIFPYVILGIDYGFDDVAKGFSEKLAESSKNNSGIDEKVAEICKGLNSTREKAEAVYKYVVDEISLKNVSMDSYSYTPKKAQEIFNNKFANDLDKAFIYHVMLEKAGVESNFCYGTAKTQTCVKGIGNIGQFSFTCVYIPELQKYVFPLLDTYSFDEIPGDYHGAEVLDIKRKGLFIVPFSSPKDNSVLMKAKINLRKDGSLLQEEEQDYYGDNAASIRNKKAMNTMEIDKEVEKRVNSVHPGASLIKYRYENLKELDKKPVFYCEYEIKDYALKAGDKYLVFRIPGMEYDASSVGKPTRQYPIYYDSKSAISNHIEITLPDGYKVYYMPKSFTVKSGPLTYSVDFKSVDNKVIFSDSIELDGNIIKVDEYSSYKELVEKRAKMSQDWLVIEKE